VSDLDGLREEVEIQVACGERLYVNEGRFCQANDELCRKCSGITGNIMTAVEEALQRQDVTAQINGMRLAKARVLRRTEVPKDARNPTRDYVVFLGEQIADIIQTDIDKLKAAAQTPAADNNLAIGMTVRHDYSRTIGKITDHRHNQPYPWFVEWNDGSKSDWFDGAVLQIVTAADGED
jgi:hypothetical protein